MGPASAGRGPRRRLSGKIPLPFPATSTSPPEAEKPSSVPPSTPGCRVRGGRQCSGAGAVTRLPSRASGLCGHKHISWGFPGRLEPKESQPPTKRKVKEKRARRNGQDKHPQRRLGEGRVAAALGRVPQVSWLHAPWEVYSSAKPGGAEPGGQGGGRQARRSCPASWDVGRGLGLSLPLGTHAGKEREGDPKSICASTGPWDARLSELRLRPGRGAGPRRLQERENVLSRDGRLPQTLTLPVGRREAEVLLKKPWKEDIWATTLSKAVGTESE